MLTTTVLKWCTQRLESTFTRSFITKPETGKFDQALSFMGISSVSLLFQIAKSLFIPLLFILIVWSICLCLSVWNIVGYRESLSVKKKKKMYYAQWYLLDSECLCLSIIAKPLQSLTLYMCIPSPSLVFVSCPAPEDKSCLGGSQKQSHI